MYTHMLAEPKLMLPFNNQGVPPWEDRALRLGWPLAVRWVRRELAIRPGIEAEDEAAVWRELDFVAELLADRKHLCGERFGAADLTFAALSAAVVVPPVYGVRSPSPTFCRPRRPHLLDARVSTPRGATRWRSSPGAIARRSCDARVARYAAALGERACGPRPRPRLV